MDKQRLRPPTQWEQAELSRNPDVARALAAVTIANAKHKSRKA
jgi:outer membrane protein TolC